MKPGLSLLALTLLAACQTAPAPPERDPAIAVLASACQTGTPDAEASSPSEGAEGADSGNALNDGPDRSRASAPMAARIAVLGQEIARCWPVPESVRTLPDLRVALRFEIDRDGNYTRILVSDLARYKGEFRYREAAKDAARALSTCPALRQPCDTPGRHRIWSLLFAVR